MVLVRIMIFSMGLALSLHGALSAVMAEAYYSSSITQKSGQANFELADSIEADDYDAYNKCTMEFGTMCCEGEAGGKYQPGLCDCTNAPSDCGDVLRDCERRNCGHLLP